eukprot:TRINITY_DN18225_c0_g1_i1.p1 TRINITY_DN18225_c0_g1~~TRINITY_DN18225_c0_g1_i1.p1  ORF type:complete len:147 (+),score=35.69 TRINITY_DN18225_c0_g1_i1:1-441(+)
MFVYECCHYVQCYFFFFNDTATTEIYTLHIVGSVRCVQETERRVHGASSVTKKRKMNNHLRIKNKIINVTPPLLLTVTLFTIKRQHTQFFSQELWDESISPKKKKKKKKKKKEKKKNIIKNKNRKKKNKTYLKTKDDRILIKTQNT